MTVRYSSPVVCSEAQKHPLIATVVSSLHPMRTAKVQQSKCLDVETLAQSDELADKYNNTVKNSFQALGSLPEDVESSWLAIRNVILQSARSTLPVFQTTVVHSRHNFNT